MTRCKTVVVHKLPESVSTDHVQDILREVLPSLEEDRPCLVFDFADARKIDSAGIDMLLRCMEEAMKRNGDVKLAAVSPQITVMLEITRVARLFETFDKPSDAIESFHHFPFQAFRQAVTPNKDGVTA